MAKKPVDKGGRARKKTSGKIKDLAADKASSVKGGAIGAPMKPALKLGSKGFDWDTSGAERRGFKF